MKFCDENYFSSIFEKIIRKERGENVKKKIRKKRRMKDDRDISMEGTL